MYWLGGTFECGSIDEDVYKIIILTVNYSEAIILLKHHSLFQSSNNKKIDIDVISKE